MRIDYESSLSADLRLGEILISRSSSSSLSLSSGRSDSVTLTTALRGEAEITLASYTNDSYFSSYFSGF